MLNKSREIAFYKLFFKFALSTKLYKMKRLLNLTFTAFLTILLFGQAPIDTNPNAPDFKFESEKHDFGEIEEGPKITHEFRFTNIGQEPLIITGAKASCGCTVPKWPKEPILPGQSSSIKVEYNTKGRPNSFNKAVTITSNAKDKIKVIYIKGNVKKATTIGSPLKPQEGPVE